MSEPKPKKKPRIPADHRAANGKFLPGNPGGPGAPRVHFDDEYREIFNKVLTPRAAEAVFKKIVACAKKGDPKAMALVCKFGLREPAKEVALQVTGGDEFAQAIQQARGDPALQGKDITADLGASTGARKK